MKKYELSHTKEKQEHGFRNLLLVADAHLNGGENQRLFFDFLDRLSRLPGTCAAGFLGDIFDLWFALPGYETEDQKRFLVWCEEEMKKRDVFFVEGNHEFFVNARRKKYFTRLAPREIRLDGLLLIHGDQINRLDWQYKLLRLILRNPLTCFLTWCAALGGIGPALAWKIRHALRDVNLRQKKRFPENQIQAYLKRASRKGICQVFAGHFHHTREREWDGCRFTVIDAFAKESEAALYDAVNRTLETGFYEKLIEKLEEMK